MTDLRTIARTAAGIFGGTPRVVKFSDESEAHSVEILSCTPSPRPGLISYSTIGMSAFDNDTVIGPRQLRVEVVGIAADSTTAFSGGLSACAFNLAHDRFQIQPKRVFPRVFEGYGQDVTTPHALIWYPFGWAGDFEPLVGDETHIEWLMAIPITDAEFTFFEANDADALIDVFEANDIDLYDLGRASAL